MVQQILLFFILGAVSFPGLAQDERFYRQMLAGEIPAVKTEVEDSPITPISVEGPFYQIDLDGDGIAEKIRPSKLNGVDWLMIYNSSRGKIFDAKLVPMGGESHIYKVRLVHLSKNTKALIIHLDEGHTRGQFFESTARIFVLTYENNDLSTLSLAEGPHFFHEVEKHPDRYTRREYRIDVTDLDGDGVREIIVHYNHIQRIMIYKGKGVWQRL